MSTSHKLDKIGLTQLWSLIASNFVAKKQGKDLSTNDFTDILKTKLDNISAGAEVNTIESIAVNGTAQMPVDKEINLVIPTGELASKDKISSTDFDNTLANAFAAKANSATSLSGYGITDAYTKTETDNKISSAISGVYKVMGSVTFANIPTAGNVEGYVYNITDAFTTTSDFVEGADKEYPAGTNIVYTSSGKWDCLAGIYDFSNYVQTSDLVDITSTEIAEICVMPS
ncbi:MAG: hypothetical protein J6X12_05975 [Paludibacteraceae bacterium]|nr:hypothetical protein [Paludibacteraceae bacterium]